MILAIWSFFDKDDSCSIRRRIPSVEGSQREDSRTVAFRTKLKAQAGAKATAKKSIKSVAKSSEKEPIPKLTTQVCADNRKKRRELLDG